MVVEAKLATELPSIFITLVLYCTGLSSNLHETRLYGLHITGLASQIVT